MPGLSQHTLALVGPPVVAVALWFAVLGIALVLTRPADVRGGPATQDLAGAEPPAVVSYLANRWTVTEDAVESTLLDLAARDHLEFRQLSDDPMATTVHLVDGRARPDDDLTSYEESVLGRVAAVAVGGVAPVTALTFRDAARAEAWWGSFSRDVIDDARRRGLARPRISRRLAAALWALAVVPAAAVALAVHAYPSISGTTSSGTTSSGTTGSDPGDGLAAAGIAAVVTFAVLSGIGGRQRGERDTPEGRRVAARWLGLRRYLKVDEAFQALPPAAVTVWDRYLAYGDALGMARVCAAVLDLGLGDRRFVWSSYGGTWHRVRVRYPHAGRTFGKSVPGVIAGALVGFGFAYALLRARAVFLDPTLNRPVARALDRGTGDLVGRIAAGLLVVALVIAARAAYRLARAVVDGFTPLTFRGEVLWLTVARTRQEDDESVPALYHLAIDDGAMRGRHHRTTAWALPAEPAQRCAPGDLVEVTVRRWTRRVLGVVVVEARPVDAVQRRSRSSRPVTADAGADREAARGKTLEALRPALLAQLADVLGATPDDVTVRPVDDGAAAGVAVDVVREGHDVPALTMVTATGHEGELLLAAHRGRGRRLAGVGSEAWSGPGWAVARDGDVTVRLGLGPRLREEVSDDLPGVLDTALRNATPETAPETAPEMPLADTPLYGTPPNRRPADPGR